MKISEKKKKNNKTRRMRWVYRQNDKIGKAELLTEARLLHDITLGKYREEHTILRMLNN